MSTPAPSSMTTDQTRSLVERYYAAMAKGDRATLAEIVASDCEWLPPSTAPFEPVQGAQAIIEALAGKVIKTMFDLKQPFALEVHETIVDGGTAVVRQRINATTASGNPYDNEYCWVYQCADGQIVKMIEYADTLLASRAMGWA